jgi:AbrB family looped-hinge helix DNA binding protein
MRATIDAAGRIVVPKELRDELGLCVGQALEISAIDGKLEIIPAPTPMQLKQRGNVLAAVSETKLPRLTAAQVRESLERTRR